MQALSWLGLHHTTKHTLKGKAIPNSEGYVTWSPPPELIGKEGALIRDMPSILTSLCEETDMIAFGHNDIVTDNAYFVAGGAGGARGARGARGTRSARGNADSDGVASFGLFDWQQSSGKSQPSAKTPPPPPSLPSSA